MHSDLGRPQAGRCGSGGGLSARLRLQAEDLGAAVRHAVWLEIYNPTPHPVVLASPPTVKARVIDASGEPVATVMLPGDGPQPEPGRVTIPAGGCSELRVDMQGSGVPLRGSGEALLALGGRCWRLPAGQYRLELEVVFVGDPRAPAAHWAGRLQPPAMTFSVTAQMFDGP